MAYISTERVAEIRNELKKKYPAFKFSITRQYSYTVCVVILTAPIKMTEKRYESVNIYSIADNYEGEAAAVLQDINTICNQGVKYRETGDYGRQPSHYVEIHLGRADNYFKHIKK